MNIVNILIKIYNKNYHLSTTHKIFIQIISLPLIRILRN